MDIQLWDEIGEFFQEMLSTLLSRTEYFVFTHGHNVALALLTLLLGWLVAAFCGQVFARLLKAVGIDVVLERIGAREFLARAEITLRPSSILGRALYWVLLWTTLMLSFKRLGFEAGADLMRTIVSWIPSVVLALVLLGLGALLGRWLGRMTARAARLAEIPFHDTIGHLVRGSILLVAGVIALDQLGVASRSAIFTGLIVLAALALLAGVSLAIFARQPVANIFARQLVAREFRTGETIVIQEVEGEILSFSATGARVRSVSANGTEEVLIPHSFLISCIVHRSGRARMNEIPPPAQGL